MIRKYRKYKPVITRVTIIVKLPFIPPCKANNQSAIIAHTKYMMEKDSVFLLSWVFQSCETAPVIPIIIANQPTISAGEVNLDLNDLAII